MGVLVAGIEVLRAVGNAVRMDVGDVPGAQDAKNDISINTIIQAPTNDFFKILPSSGF